MRPLNANSRSPLTAEMLGVRELMARYGLATAAIALLVAGMAWWFIFRPDSRESVAKSYYYDLGTQKLFVDSSLKNPPITAPSGGEGVLAHVYTVGRDDQKVIGFLEKLTPELKRKLDQAGAGSSVVPPGKLERSRLIRRVADEQWFPMDSEQAKKIVAELTGSDRGFTLCHP